MNTILQNLYVLNVGHHKNKMVEVTNDIKILYKKSNTEVLFEEYIGKLILYNNDNFNTNPLLKGSYIFTGICLPDLSSAVSFKFTNLSGENINYMLHKQYIYVKNINNEIKIGEPIAILTFIPSETHWAGDEFFAHMIELN